MPCYYATEQIYQVEMGIRGASTIYMGPADLICFPRSCSPSYATARPDRHSSPLQSTTGAMWKSSDAMHYMICITTLAMAPPECKNGCNIWFECKQYIQKMKDDTRWRGLRSNLSQQKYLLVDVDQLAGLAGQYTH